MPYHLLTFSLAILGLTSCGLVKSAVQIPASALQTAGRTVGIQLTATETVMDDLQENQGTESPSAIKSESTLDSE